MLTVNGLKEFYFLPRMYDMRCGYHRIMEIIKTRYGRRPEDGEVFFFMSKDLRRVRMVYYDRGSFNVYTKTFACGYRFMRIEVDDEGRMAYRVDWKDIVSILESPVVKSIRPGVREMVEKR